MPTYQYKCKQCGYELEELQSMTEAPLVQCPQCKTDNLTRVLGTGGALIFKGSGFYLTDYKKDTRTAGKTSSQEGEKTGSKKESKNSPPSTDGPPSSGPSTTKENT
jgi:putative FmdB family regulatory protein